MQLGAMTGNIMVYPLKVGERSGPLGPCRSRAKPALPRRAGRCRDWTGGAYGPLRRPKAKGQSRPRTSANGICPADGGENRSGKNPGAVGSNPAADTIHQLFCGLYQVEGSKSPPLSVTSQS